jgi:choline dehydrogenase-like flavoprotein
MLTMASKSDVKIDSGDGISRRGLLKGIAAAGVVALTPARTMAEPTTQTFNYVVVGSGPGGGPLACNLAKAGYAVCLMEAGGPATDPDLQLKIELPIDAPAASADPRIAWEYFVRHSSCSNQMGRSSDPMAVVDSEFKVIGTRNLRVVDASVFPQIPGYYPMIPIMMISEKASEVILADARSDRTKRGNRKGSAARPPEVVPSRSTVRMSGRTKDESEPANEQTLCPIPYQPRLFRV